MPPTRGDGNLYISFVSMGQGDCILVSCPNGKTMMIDCGTARWDTDFITGINRDQTKEEQKTQRMQLRQGVIDTVYEPRFLAGYDTLDVLILTHPDKDHCNEIASVLKQGITINALYHSTTIDKYIEGGADSWLHSKANVGAEYAITINQNKRQINGADILDADNANVINRLSTASATKGFVKILDGKKGAGKSCDVYILASNVVKYPNVDDSETKIENRASVVTMIIYGSQKFLFCGDATVNTEKFLLSRYNTVENGNPINRIADLEVVQVGHHGSLTSSSHSTDNDPNVSAIAFVDKVNPRIAIISAATYHGGFKLPRYKTVAKYILGVRMNVLNHSLGCWVDFDAVYDESGKKRKLITEAYVDYALKPLTKHIISTGDSGTIDVERTDGDV